MPVPRSDLVEALAAHVGVPPLTEAEIDACLALAGDAAHSTGDRTSAPLAVFLAGISAARTDDRGATLAEMRRQIAALASPAG